MRKNSKKLREKIHKHYVELIKAFYDLYQDGNDDDYSFIADTLNDIYDTLFEPFTINNEGDDVLEDDI